MDIIAETLITSVRYASSLTLRGAVINQDVTVTDASRYKGIGLISDIATILVADASSADVYVNKIISVNVHNASSLYYLGDPIFEKKEIYDASSLKVFN